MSKRNNLVRAALVLLVLAVVATLVVLNQQRGQDVRGFEGESSARPSPTPTQMASPHTTTAPPDEPRPGEEIPTPPAGIEDIVCRKVQRSVAVRVLSFNTHRSFGSNGLARVAAEIRATSADIVLLQEIDRFYGRTGHVDQIAYLAEQTGMHQAFSANVTSGGGGQYGTGILSRFKIVDSGRYGLPNAPGGEQRGLQWATVDVAGRRVRVYNTHLQNRMSALRESQARYVAGILGADDLPKVIGGDFNATINTATLRAVLAHVADPWATVGGSSLGTGPGGSRIDFVLADPSLQPTAAGVVTSSVSDHNPTYADLIVPAGTSCPTGRRKPAQ